MICQCGFMAHPGTGPPQPPQDPLTFSALAAVGVGAIHALGPILAGGAGTLVDVKLAEVPVEAWKGGRSHVPAQGWTRQAPSLPPAAPAAPLPRSAGPPHPGWGAGFPWGRLLGALNAGLRPTIESILFTSLEEQSL